MSQIAHPPTRLVSDFVRRWRDISAVYEKLALEAKRRCEDGLSAVKCIITERAKSAHSLEASIKRRQAARGREYQDEDEIIEDMVDLAGVRIALYFPGDAKVVEKFIAENFDTVKEPVLWGVNEAGDFTNQEMGTRFIGYRATHYRVKLKSEHEGREISWALSDRTVEIQVTSVVMHAWANVHHDLIYKPYSGEITEDEKRVLDLINGLAHAGEVALQQLQTMLERRIHRMDANQKFEDQYELATWLKTYIQRKTGDTFKNLGPRMEYLKVLVEVLQIYQLDTPQQLETCFIGASDNAGDQSFVLKAGIDRILNSIASHSHGKKMIDKIDISIWTLLNICKRKMILRSESTLQDARQKGFVMIQSINIALSLGCYTKKLFTTDSGKALRLIHQLLIPTSAPIPEEKAVELVNRIWNIYTSELASSLEEPHDWFSDDHQSLILWVLSCSLAWTGIVAVPESIPETPDRVFLWPGHLGWPSWKAEVDIGQDFERTGRTGTTYERRGLQANCPSPSFNSASVYVFMRMSPNKWKEFSLDNLKNVSSWKYSQVSMDKVTRGQWIEETEDKQEIQIRVLDGQKQGEEHYRSLGISSGLPGYQSRKHPDHLIDQKHSFSAHMARLTEAPLLGNGQLEIVGQRQSDHQSGEREDEYRNDDGELESQKEDKETGESEEGKDSRKKKGGCPEKEGQSYNDEKQEQQVQALKKQEEHVASPEVIHRGKQKRAQHRATEEVFERQPGRRNSRRNAHYERAQHLGTQRSKRRSGNRMNWHQDERDTADVQQGISPVDVLGRLMSRYLRR